MSTAPIPLDSVTAPYGALLLRIALGTMLIAHGLLKVLVFTIPGTVGYFESIGYPGFFAYLVIAAELGGGALLVLGVQTRLVALALVPVLLGAAIEHAGNGWVFSSPGGGWEFPVFWSVALAAQSLLGGGAYSVTIRPLDHAVARILGRSFA